MNAIQERNVFRLSGWAVVALDLLLAAVLVGSIVSIAGSAKDGEFPLALIPFFLLMIGWILLKPGYFLVHPNEAKVFVFLGKYVGSERRPGFHWTNPFAVRRKVSLRMNNFNSPTIKVNDSLGNPIEIAAVVVWRVADSAKATFDVE
ncbi:MAG TPA: SPFH domain-containing protein, partial [Candidatus Aminicenantes bacterium]|nr:SPFH domain-containing protein [Candidatus Aminicenantes bacterium]